MRRIVAALWLLLAPLAAPAADLVSLPPLAARVTDLTGTLTADQRASLDAALAGIEQAKGAQVAVLLLSTTQPETIEQFGIRLAEAWKVGRRGVNDGVIIIVAKADRKMRIEVGYGLEGTIPDAVAKRIVAEQMAPRFRQGDFHGGLLAAAQTLAQAIGQEALPAPAAPSAGDSGTGIMGSDELENAFWVALVVLFSGLLRLALGLLGSFAAAGIAGWLALTFFGSWIGAIVAGLLAFIFSFFRIGRSGKGTGGSRYSSSGSGYSSSSGGGSWSSDSGGSDFGGGGGDFGGGGGDFGGGGASGDW